MFVTNSLTGGGAERAMNLAANELVKHGWTVASVPINSGPPDFIQLSSITFPLHREWRGGLISTTKAFINFIVITVNWKPDVLIVTCDLPELFGAFLPLRLKLVVVEEAKAPWGTRMGFGRLVRRILRARNANWVAASHHLKIWPQGSEPNQVIPNALTYFDKGKIRNDFHPSKERLIFVGRMSPEKRPNWFIEVCKKTEIPGRIFGTGFMAADLQKSVAAAGIEFDFCGFVSNPWAYTDDKDLLIVPSASEGDGLVVVEAIAAGLPILLSDIPEFRHFGLAERHYCVDVSAFAERVRDFKGRFDMLIVDEVQSIGILSNRSPSTIGDAWHKYLENLSDSK